MYKRYNRKTTLSAKNSKYNNVKIVKHLNLKRISPEGEISFIDQDWKFDSQLEYAHFLEYQDMEKCGEIEHYIFKPDRLELSPSYKEMKLRPSYYHPDHLLIFKDGSRKYVDSKGFSTDIFKLKQKIVYDRHKIYVEARYVKTNNRSSR